jgi:hypothetical protein
VALARSNLLGRITTSGGADTGTSGAGTWGTSDWTPSVSIVVPANSLVVVGGFLVENNASTTDPTSAFSVSDSGAHTWTPISGATAVVSPTSVPALVKTWTAQFVSGATVSLTFTTAGRNIGVYGCSVVSFTGYDTATPTGAVGGNSNASPGGPPNPASLTLGASPATTSEVLGFAGADRSTAGATPGSTFTEIHDVTNTDWGGIESEFRDSSTSTTVDWVDLRAGGGALFNWAVAGVEIIAASTSAVPYNPQRITSARDYGESYWIQKDRRNANLVATAANDLAPPLLVPEHQWQQYRVSDFISRRLVPQQPDRHLRALDAAAANDLAMPLLQPVEPRYDVTTRLRGAWPQQRERESDPSLLSPAVAMDPPAVQRYIPPRDYGEVQWHQTSGRDPLLLTTALLENELLGGAETDKRTNLPATHTARWWMPQQPQREAYSPGLLDTALLEGPLVWIRPPQYVVDRREVPQQRAYVSDPSFYSVAGVDPLTVAWGAGGNYWHLYNDVRVERRLVPQQRQLESDPNLLLTALLESPLLVGSFRQIIVDRRVQPRQLRWPDLMLELADPLVVGGGVGGDRWRRYNTPATHVDRRQTVRERPRWTVYTTVDLGLGPNPPFVSTTPPGTYVSQSGTGSTQQTVTVAFVSQDGAVIVSQTPGGVL